MNSVRSYCPCVGDCVEGVVKSSGAGTYEMTN